MAQVELQAETSSDLKRTMSTKLHGRKKAVYEEGIDYGAYVHFMLSLAPTMQQRKYNKPASPLQRARDRLLSVVRLDTRGDKSADSELEMLGQASSVRVAQATKKTEYEVGEDVKAMLAEKYDL